MENDKVQVKRIQVIRIIRMIGTPEWIKSTLDKCAVAPGKPLFPAIGDGDARTFSIQEIVRNIDEIDEFGEPLMTSRDKDYYGN